MMGFEEQWDNDGFLSNCSMQDAKYFYEAGAASRQAEIDELKLELESTRAECVKSYSNVSDANLKCAQQQDLIDELQTDVEGLQNDLIKAAEGQMKLFEHNNELQKQINEALKVFKSDLSPIGKFDTIHNILKGEIK